MVRTDDDGKQGAERPSEPVRKTIEVAAPVADAFRIWTEEIARWWPLASHSVSQADAIACVLEGRVGGRIYESERSGDEHLWGTVTLWDAPRRIVHSWHPGRPATEATIVEIGFSPAPQGGTRIDLVHDGWPPDATARRANYERGWAKLLREHYAAYVCSAQGSD